MHFTCRSWHSRRPNGKWEGKPYIILVNGIFHSRRYSQNAFQGFIVLSSVCWALLSVLSISQTQRFLVPVLCSFWYCSCCNTSAAAGLWVTSGSSVAWLDSVDAHHVRVVFHSLSCHMTSCFFSARQRKTRWVGLHSCELAQLRGMLATHELPGITTYVPHCAGLDRNRTAGNI